MKNILLLLPVILIVLQCCNEMYCGTDDYVALKNNANDTILVLAKINAKDTLLPESLFDYPFDNCVVPGDISSINIVYSDIGNNDSVIFFVVRKQEFCKLSWQDIKKNNKITARYLLKQHEIGSFNSLEIPYPPDNTMKNMNVYYNTIKP